MSSDRDIALWRAYIQDVVPLNQRAVARQSPVSRRIERLPLGHTLDLHGMTLAAAHAQTIEMLSTAGHQYRYITIITGISGAIRQEFLHWVNDHPSVRGIEGINGGGGFRVYFRKR